MIHIQSQTLRLVIALLIGLGTARPAASALVYLKGVQQPLAGFVESQNDESLMLRMTNQDGTILRRQIRKVEIELLLQPVSSRRLEQLTPQRPEEYRLYAEDLVEKRTDPEAVETARRLFVIAAWLDPAGQGRSSMLGLTQLANNEQEIRTLRALAYLLDPRHDQELLRAESRTSDPVITPNDQIRESLIQMFQALRRGKKSEPALLLQNPQVEQVLREATIHISPEECQQLIRGTCSGCDGNQVPPYLLRKLIAAELDLSNSRRVPLAETNWGSLAEKVDEETTPVFSLLHVTSYDPRKSIYRDGVWSVPSDE